MSEVNGREQAERVLVRGFGALRLAQYATAGAAAVSTDRSAYLRPGVVFGLYAVAAVWSLVLYGAALRGRRITSLAVVADVLLIGVALVVIGRLTAPGHAIGWANWTVGPANAAGVLAVVFSPRRLAGPSILLLSGCYLAGVWRDLAAGSSPLASATGNIGSLVLFTVAAGFAAAWVRSSARAADEAHAAALAAQRQAADAAARMASVEARDWERRRQYRNLHDTVLSTLTVGAMGQIDLNTEQFRSQCERDARYLRSLITGSDDAMSTDLGAGLGRVMRDLAALGLRIDHNAAELPTGVPGHVTEALLGATREALNNARKHAGTGQAWLTTRGDDAGGVRVTVVDRGAGFVPAATRSGYGLLGSIRHRVVEAGGQCDITSTPGEGTTVEITWKPS
ncbi:ATP-binding protein [Plantactinospora sp. ZYX-F-223]|uniref:sensor histidine kinase n=1 Tax=Plantactinospora sp. ZYX-F-223 TaxID=3144103 RepID=UPI0031FD1333